MAGHFPRWPAHVQLFGPLREIRNRPHYFKSGENHLFAWLQPARKAAHGQSLGRHRHLPPSWTRIESLGSGDSAEIDENAD